MRFSFRTPSFKQIQLVFIGLLVLAAGISIFIVKQQTDNRTKASTSPLQEVENGQIIASGNTAGTVRVTIANDSTASSGKYIQFGAPAAQPQSQPVAIPTPTSKPQAIPPTATPKPTNTPIPPSIPTKSGILGASLDQWSVSDRATKIINTYNFAWFTPGNELKMQFLDKCDGSYAFAEQGDKYVKYAKDNGMKVIGHTLVWHNQTSPCAGNYSLDQFKKYIRDVATHYCQEPYKVHAFDVVNEALSDGGGYRSDSIWYKKFGASYIETAFQTARSACPSMKLYYNDYNTEGGQKAEDMMNLIVKPLADKGLIDGVGFQAHIVASDGLGSLGSTMNQVTNTTNKATGEKLEVAISEMDVRFGRAYTSLTAQDYALQANIYKTAATLCKNNPKCVRFTTWGIDDGTSWLNSTDVGQGIHQEAALLFDRNFAPKPAYCTGVQPVLGTPRGAC